MIGTNFLRSTLILGLLAGSAMVLDGCGTIRIRSIWGDVEYEPAPGEDPNFGGTWRRTTIDGRCFVTNGRICIPCDGGVLGKAVPCVGIGPGDGQHEQQRGGRGEPLDIQGSNELWTSAFKLMRGLDGQQLANFYHFNERPADQPIHTDVLVNLFDSDSRQLDVTMILPFQSGVPMPGGYDNGVYIEMLWLGGDPTDNQVDAVALRLRGDADSVANVMAAHGNFTMRMRTEEGIVQVKAVDGLTLTTLSGRGVHVTTPR